MTKEIRLETPVLLIAFNRPEATKKVFEQIRKVKPKKLFLSVDGPRGIKDNEKVEEVKNIISKVDWPCKVEKIFSEENLGCNVAIPKAISYMFKKEETGIILEDDCIPSTDFFWFCQDLLEKYKNNNLTHIGGFNPLFEKAKKIVKEDYYFTHNVPTWGWATWKNSWKNYEKYCNDLQEIKSYVLKKLRKNLLKKFSTKQSLLITFSEKGGWDSRFSYINQFMNKFYETFGIISKNNLVVNIGFGADATHTKKIDSRANITEYGDLNHKISHPKEVRITYHFDEYKFNNWYYLIKGIRLFLRRNTPEALMPYINKIRYFNIK